MYSLLVATFSFLQKQNFMNFFTMLRMNQPRREEQPEIVEDYARQIEEEEGRRPVKVVREKFTALVEEKGPVAREEKAEGN